MRRVVMWPVLQLQTKAIQPIRSPENLQQRFLTCVWMKTFAVKINDKDKELWIDH